MSGRTPSRKGDATERMIVRLLRARGFAAMPLSGAAGGRFGANVSLLDVDRRCMIHDRTGGFREFYRRLADGADVLILRDGRREPLVVVPFKLAAVCAELAERGSLILPRASASSGASPRENKGSGRKEEATPAAPANQARRTESHE
jgi:hypothetical protein